MADENKRWSQNFIILKQERVTIVGDALVSAAFILYIGSFSFSFKAELWKDNWLVDMNQRSIPNISGVDFLEFL